MRSTMITGTHSSFNIYPSKPNISTAKSFLQPPFYLNFHTHFSKSTFPLRTLSKSTLRTSPIKAVAAVAETVYVNTQNFYELLSISESGTLSEIKKAYKQLARKYHPDVSSPDRTEEYTKRFIEVQEAYETLSDPERRALYDRDLARGFHSLFQYVRNRSHSNNHTGFVDRDEWEQRWQSLLDELIRASNGDRDSDSMSWGARMRSKRCHAN